MSGSGGGGGGGVGSAGGGNLTVAVRVRPLNAKERGRNAHSCLVCQDGRQINVIDPDEKMGGIDYLRLDRTKDKSYAFDHAFDDTITQQQVYEGTAARVVPDVLNGGNACVFAYGATGSGKTFTMMGTNASPGVVLLTTDALFATSAADEENSVSMTMQYVEIYNEMIKDLLEPSNSALDVREAPSKGTFVAGAARVVVASRAELEALIHKGNLYRTTEATNVNEVSSRSHAVLQLHVESTPRFDERPATKVGKLSMIDLAGSERASKTGNQGKRLTEGQNINRSLLALANCINALADKTKRHGHVPYRDSKLTRLLKDSLGGHCKTVMITNVSPASDQFDETLNSLKYANRAKNIRTKDVTVTVHRPAPVEQQLAMVRELRDSFGKLLPPKPSKVGWHANTRGGAQPDGARQLRTRAPSTPEPRAVAQAAKRQQERHGGVPGSAPGPRDAKNVGFLTGGGMAGALDDGYPSREAPPSANGGEGSEGGSAGGGERPSRTMARLWQSITQNSAWAEAHAVLDALERGAVAELQMALAALLAERSHLVEERANWQRERWHSALHGTFDGSASGWFFSSRHALSLDAPPPGAEGDADGDRGSAREWSSALEANARELMQTRDTFLDGLPSDERSVTAAVMWENAVLRAEVHAGRLALGQLHTHLNELADATKDDGSAALIRLMGAWAATREREQSIAIDSLGADPFAPRGATPSAPSAPRSNFLAELVPSMMRHSASQFGHLLRQTREMLKRHRGERERLCSDLSQLKQAPPSPRPGVAAETSQQPASTAHATNTPSTGGNESASNGGADSSGAAYVAGGLVGGPAGGAAAGRTPRAEMSPGPREGSIERLIRGVSNRFSLASLRSPGKKSPLSPVRWALRSANGNGKTPPSARSGEGDAQI